MNYTSIPVHAPLYTNLNYEALNWGEQRWADWYLWMDNPSLATGIMSFVMHEVSRASQATKGINPNNGSSYILVVAFPGSSSTQFLISGVGNFNQCVNS
jgi:hypothetical protein